MKHNVFSGFSSLFFWKKISFPHFVSYLEHQGYFFPPAFLIQVPGNIVCKVRMLYVPCFCKALQEYNTWHQRCHSKSLSP